MSSLESASLEEAWHVLKEEAKIDEEITQNVFDNRRDYCQWGKYFKMEKVGII